MYNIATHSLPHPEDQGENQKSKSDTMDIGIRTL